MSEPITDLATAVAALGALPMPAGRKPLDPSYEASLQAVAAAHSDDPDTAVYRQHIGALLTEIRRQREELTALAARLAEVESAPFSIEGGER
jgi:hypothetical protein